MDAFFGSVIDDYTLFRIISGIIMVLILAAIYLAIQITLSWKFLNKGETNANEIISNKTSFYKNTFFIFIAGFFMIIHEFLEGFEEPDSTTYEFFELIALSGLILFMWEWNKLLKKIKKMQQMHPSN